MNKNEEYQSRHGNTEDVDEHAKIIDNLDICTTVCEPPKSKDNCSWWRPVSDAWTLKPGDHISWWCKDGMLPYYRHAIVVSSKNRSSINTIIGWVLDSPKEIKEISYDFSRVQPIHKAEYLNNCYDEKEVVRRAKSQLGDKTFNLFTNTIWAFPRWCHTGYGGLFYNPPKDRLPEWKYPGRNQIEMGDHLKWNYGFFSTISHGIVCGFPDNNTISIVEYKLNTQTVTQTDILWRKTNIQKAVYKKWVLLYTKPEIAERAQLTVGDKNLFIDGDESGEMIEDASFYPRWCVTEYGHLLDEKIIGRQVATKMKVQDPFQKELLIEHTKKFIPIIHLVINMVIQKRFNTYNDLLCYLKVNDETKKLFQQHFTSFRLVILQMKTKYPMFFI